MNDVDVVILHGPPASGKSTLAQEMSDILKEHDVTHACIDMDYLAKVYPRNFIGMQYKNLAAVWSNYCEMGRVKIILITYLQKDELEVVKRAAPAKSTLVYEIIASIDVLKKRIVKRTNNVAQQKRHIDLAENYESNGPLAEQIDFSLINDNKPVRTAALEVLDSLNWIP